MSHLAELRPLGRALTLAGLLVACAEAKEPQEAAKTSAIRVEVATLRPTRFEDRIEATGSLEAENDVSLSARSPGTVQELKPLGARVKAGEVVARIDPGLAASGVRQAEAARAAAAASLALAEETYGRQRPLFDEGVISALEMQSIQAQREQARAQLAQAEASLGQARESLENTRVVAPFPGVVDRRSVERGEQVSPGTPILRVVDASRLKVRAGLPERYAADIEVGAEVQVSLPTYGLEPRKGTVRFVATAIDPRTRTFDVEVAIDNEGGRLKPEMVVNLVVTRASLDGVLVVPQDAVLRDEIGPHVFVVVEEEGRSVARRRPVSLGGRAAGQVVVEGPFPRDRVVVTGQTKLIDGDVVEVSEMAS